REGRLVGVSAAGTPTDELRTVVHRKDDGSAWLAGDVFVSGAWKELITINEKPDRWEIPGGYMTQRTRDLWQRAAEDARVALKEAESLGTKNQSVPYGGCEECSNWDW